MSKTYFNFKGLVFALVLVVYMVCTVTTIAECEGTWQESSALTCTSGTVCAEWDVGGTSSGSCCIPPEEIGSGNLEACQGGLTP